MPHELGRRAACGERVREERRCAHAGGPGHVIGYLGTTCCSQFDSNTQSEAQASEVSTVRVTRRGRIFEILKSRKMVSV
eukprot:scaffold76810_cov69-Phaeocystis_antarctica.AAC.1